MEGLLSRVLRYWRPERKETTALAGRDERRGAPVLMWFRRDLRLADNPALAWASESGRPVIPFFLLDDEERRRGGASRWWLHGSLDALGGSLARIGSRLVLRRGPAGEAVSALAEETGAADIVWNRLYEPALVERDTAIKAQCRDAQAWRPGRSMQRCCSSPGPFARRRAGITGCSRPSGANA